MVLQKFISRKSVEDCYLQRPSLLALVIIKYRNNVSEIQQNLLAKLSEVEVSLAFNQHSLHLDIKR